MWSAVFALTDRTLRVDHRSLKQHLLRAATLAVVYLILVASSQGALFSDAAGLRMFSRLMWLDLLFVIVAMTAFFATAITEEKEELTLGLLKLAGIRPATLLFGKFLPRMTLTFVGLIAQVPFIMIAITLGGVSGAQIRAALVCLVSFLWLASSLGLLCSVVCSRARAASTLSLVLLLAMFAGPWMIERALVYLSSSISWFSIDHRWLVPLKGLAESNPFARMQNITFATSTHWYDTQVGVSVLCGCLFCVLSWLVFDPFTQNLVGPVTGPRPTFAKVPFVGRRFSPGRVWPYPMLWKDMHFFAGGWMAVLATLVIHGAVIATWVVVQSSAGMTNWTEMSGLLVAFAAFTIFAQGSFFVGRFLSNEVNDRTWSQLYLLPRSTFGLIVEKLLAGGIVLIPSFLLLGFALVAMSVTSNEPAVILFAVPQSSSFLLFLSFLALISLYVKWGAFPIALFVTYFATAILNMFVAVPLMLLTSGMGWATPSVFGMVTVSSLASLGTSLLGIVLCCRWTVRRLRACAAQ